MTQIAVGTQRWRRYVELKSVSQEGEELATRTVAAGTRVNGTTQEAARAGSNWIETPLAIGICQLNLKHYNEAIASFEACLTLDSKYQPALFTKAVALHLTWNFDGAVKAYEAILAIDPRCEESLLNMISLGLQQKNFELIETYSKRLLDIKPGVPQALEGLAVSAFARGDFSVAEKHYKG